MTSIQVIRLDSTALVESSERKKTTHTLCSQVGQTGSTSTSSVAELGTSLLYLVLAYL